MSQIKATVFGPIWWWTFYTAAVSFERWDANLKKWLHIYNSSPPSTTTQNFDPNKLFILANSIIRQLFQRWFDFVCSRLPCEVCLGHSNQILKSRPLNFDTPALLYDSLWHFYSAVNQRTKSEDAFTTKELWFSSMQRIFEKPTAKTSFKLYYYYDSDSTKFTVCEQESESKEQETKKLKVSPLIGTGGADCFNFALAQEEIGNSWQEKKDRYLESNKDPLAIKLPIDISKINLSKKMQSFLKMLLRLTQPSNLPYWTKILIFEQIQFQLLASNTTTTTTTTSTLLLSNWIEISCLLFLQDFQSEITRLGGRNNNIEQWKIILSNLRLHSASLLFPPTAQCPRSEKEIEILDQTRAKADKVVICFHHGEDEKSKEPTINNTLVEEERDEQALAQELQIIEQRYNLFSYTVTFLILVVLVILVYSLPK